MFCYNCGSEVGENSYCPKCGAKQKTAGMSYAQNPAPVMNAAPAQGTMGKQRRMNVGIVVGIAAALIAVLAVIVVVLIVVIVPLIKNGTRGVQYEAPAAAGMSESAGEDSAVPAASATSVAYEDIPQTLAEVEGYRPYIIRFLLNGEPSGDFVPYFYMDGQLLDMEEAEARGYIRNIQAYRTDGVSCKVMTVVDENSGAVELTHNAVFVFYVKQDAELRVYPASSADLMHFCGNLFELYTHYGAAEVEQKGWGGTVNQYTLEPNVDFTTEGTVMLLDCKLEPYRTKLWDGTDYRLEHYFYFYTGFSDKEISAGSE